MDDFKTIRQGKAAIVRLTEELMNTNSNSKQGVEKIIELNGRIDRIKKILKECQKMFMR